MAKPVTCAGVCVGGIVLVEVLTSGGCWSGEDGRSHESIQCLLRFSIEEEK